MNRSRRGTVLAIIAGFTFAAGAAGTPAQQCKNPHVKRAAFAQSFECNMDLRLAGRSPVLLVPGTWGTPAGFAWSWLPALQAHGWPVCTVALPDNATAPIQDSAAYIEYAIREAHRLSGRRVQIFGFSQGGMAPRWVLRFSPATRNMVDDMVSVSAPNHGAVLATAFCDDGPYPDQNGVIGCPAALWQQRPDSNFLAAVNDRYETVPGVDYTAIYTRYDDVIGLNSGPAPSSALRATGLHVANIALQDICPANTAGHPDAGWDPVGYAIVLDALAHKGPANVGRLLQGGAPGSQALCAEVYMPGIDPATFEQDLEAGNSAFLDIFFSTANVTGEPTLPCYSRGNGP
jgi:triacylglycerol esterase/lipase EstA (alpha/beta hydrolase family)